MIRKILLTTAFITILFLINSAQTDIPKVNVSNVKTGIWDDLKIHIGVSINFDIQLISDNDLGDDKEYYISAVIKDSTGKVLVDDKSIYTVFYVKSYKKVNNRYIDKGLSLFLSKSKLNLPPGKFKLQCILNAWNNEEFIPEIYKGYIDVISLNQYDFEEQEFDISTLQVTEDIKNGQKGLLIKFNVAYKFMSQQIKDFDNNENHQYYYFYPVIKDKNNNLVYTPPDNIPDYDTHDYYKTFAKGENEYDKIEFFISYRNLNTKPGNKSLRFYIYASSKLKDIIFPALAAIEKEASIPEKYFAEIEVKKISVKYAEYDVANVIGQIFSKKYKNKGKGYPDVLWRINTGYDKMSSFTRLFMKT
ncbi:MAG: hypothetical protein Kow0068_18120 [Marinilabiliales bacterium]